jgi:predicted ATPase
MSPSYLANEADLVQNAPMRMIDQISISGYRSLRDVRLGLGALNVVTGANGSGKSSLYRALRLLADVAQGRIIQSLAMEGGLASALWAGPEAFARSVKQGVHPVEGTRRRHPVSLKLGFSSEEIGYAIDLGLPIPPPPPTRFSKDPEIKRESVWAGELLGRTNVYAERVGPSVRIRDRTGAWRQAMHDLAPFDSMLTHCSDPFEALELLALRERVRNWRFYDYFRTDAEAPARRAQIGTRTPVLAGDGADLAAAIATIQEIGASDELDETIADAFPGAQLEVGGAGAHFELEFTQHGLLRPLNGAELSDGTLRYLLLTAALLSPRPPELMILNEPETSLHPDLLAPLARLIARVSSHSQIIVVSHAQALVTGLRAEGAREITLAKQLGETIVEGEDAPRWNWPAR